MRSWIFLKKVHECQNIFFISICMVGTHLGMDTLWLRGHFVEGQILSPSLFKKLNFSSMLWHNLHQKWLTNKCDFGFHQHQVKVAATDQILTQHLVLYSRYTITKCAGNCCCLLDDRCYLRFANMLRSLCLIAGFCCDAHECCPFSIIVLQF